MLYTLEFCLWATEKNSLNNFLLSHESVLAIVSAAKFWKSSAGVRYSLPRPGCRVGVCPCEPPSQTGRRQ